MTVSSQTNKVIYIGNGVATEFAIPFSFLEREHIKVRQKKNDIQTERTDWTVKGGNLVFADAPESGAEIAIVREVPLTQETDYRDNEILHAETLERSFDKLTMQVQQLAEKSARAVTVDIFDDTAADSLIPSIRKAVSDCQTAAETSTAQAENAQGKAQKAEEFAVNARNSEIHTAAMLETKANIDADNLSINGKKNIAAYVFPNTTGAVHGIFNSRITTTEQTFTATQSGYLCLAGDLDAYSYLIGYLNDVSLFRNGSVTNSGTSGFSVFIPMKEGDTFTIKAYQNTCSLYCNVFVPSNF